MCPVSLCFWFSTWIPSLFLLHGGKGLLKNFPRLEKLSPQKEGGWKSTSLLYACISVHIDLGMCCKILYLVMLGDYGKGSLSGCPASFDWLRVALPPIDTYHGYEVWCSSPFI